MKPMRTFATASSVLSVAFCVFCAVGALAIFEPSRAHAREPMPEVSHDGLHLVKDEGFTALYLKPGASLAPYDELIILDCFVAFKKDWAREQRENDRFVTSREMDVIKKHLAKEFRSIFIKELQDKGGYKVVTSGAPNVMILRPAIIDLDVVAPDSASDLDERTFSASSGQMTLYMELYDSVTNDILARIIDPESARGSEMIEWRNAVSNTADADRILRRWADVLRRDLDDAHTRAAR